MLSERLWPARGVGPARLPRRYVPRPDDPLIAVALNHGSLHLASETHIRAHVAGLPARVLITRTRHGPVAGEHGPLLSYSAPARAARLLRRLCRISTQQTLESAALERYWRRHAVQLVLAQYGVNGVVSMRACRRAGLPLVTHFRGFDVYRQDVVEPLREAYRELFDSGTRMITPSAAMAQTLVDMGAERDRIDVVPSGADTALFRAAAAAANPPLFFMAGRLVEKKAPQVTLRAFAEVLRQLPQTRLRIAGDGPLRPRCERLIDQLGIAHAVTLLGAQPQSVIAAEMRRARAVVLHSVTAADGDAEGAPVVIQEAGACALPVVATRHQGIVDIVAEDETGLLVDEYDVDAMAAQMLRLARDPQLAARLGAAARRRVQQTFSLDAAVAGVWRSCQRAMAEYDAGSVRARRSPLA